MKTDNIMSIIRIYKSYLECHEDPTIAMLPITVLHVSCEERHNQEVYVCQADVEILETSDYIVKQWKILCSHSGHEGFSCCFTVNGVKYPCMLTLVDMQPEWMDVTTMNMMNPEYRIWRELSQVYFYFSAKMSHNSFYKFFQLLISSSLAGLSC